MNLSDQQKNAVEKEGNVLVSACPGAGKTRTLVVRAKYKLEKIPEYRSLALITYTNAAVDEISSRIQDDSRMYIGTIHSFCMEYILRPFSWLYKQDGWKKPKIISFEQRKEFINLLEENNISFKWNTNKYDQLNLLKRELDGSIDTEVEGWKGKDSKDSIEKVAELYFDYLYSKGVIDFNEILYRSYRIVKENDFVCTGLANKFYEILVDEFQDTNIFQYEILKLLNQRNKCTFFMVGDQNQAIMRFAGAINNVFDKAENDFNTVPIYLTQTYRSTNDIIDTYTSIVDNHPRIVNKSQYVELSEEIGIFDCSSNSYKSHKWNECRICDNNTSRIGTEIKKLLNKGITEAEIAILSPWGSDCKKVSEKLGAEYNFVGINSLPHYVEGIKDSTFYLLQSILRYFSHSSMKNLRSVRRNIEMYLLENSIQIEDEKLLTNKLLIEVFKINKNEMVCNALSKIKIILDDLFGIENSTIEEIVNEIKNGSSINWSIDKYSNIFSQTKGIYNDTIHSAKGLEFDAVILNCIDEGKIPHKRGDNEASEQSVIDGLRVLYVGLSRARKYLKIIHSNNKCRFLKKVNSIGIKSFNDENIEKTS